MSFDMRRDETTALDKQRVEHIVQQYRSDNVPLRGCRVEVGARYINDYTRLEIWARVEPMVHGLTTNKSVDWSVGVHPSSSGRLQQVQVLAVDAFKRSGASPTLTNDRSAEGSDLTVPQSEDKPVTKKIVLWTLGSIEHQILPSAESIDKLKGIIKEARETSSKDIVDVVWGPELSVTLIDPDHGISTDGKGA